MIQIYPIAYFAHPGQYRVIHNKTEYGQQVFTIVSIINDIADEK